MCMIWGVWFGILVICIAIFSYTNCMGFIVWVDIFHIFYFEKVENNI